MSDTLANTTRTAAPGSVPGDGDAPGPEPPSPGVADAPGPEPPSPGVADAPGPEPPAPGDKKLSKYQRNREAILAREKKRYAANKEAYKEKNRKAYERTKYLRSLGLQALEQQKDSGARSPGEN